MKKVYFFEDITLMSLPFILWGIFFNYEIFIFEFTNKPRKYKFIKEAISAGKIKMLYVYPAHGISTFAVEKSIELLDKKKNKYHFRLLSKLFNDQNVLFVFKKSLVTPIYNARFISFFLNDYYKKENLSIKFFGKNYFNITSLLKKSNINIDLLYINENIKKTNTSKYFSFDVFIFKLKFIFKIVNFTILSIYQIILLAKSKEKSEKKIPLIGWSVNSPWLMKFSGNRKYNFIIDGDRINANQVVYIIETTLNDTLINEEKLKGMHFAHLTKRGVLKYALTNNILGKDSFKFFINIIFGLFYLKESVHIVNGFLSIVSQNLYWSVLLKEYNIKKYVYTNNESYVQCATDIILKNKKVDVYKYQIFIGGGYLYEDEENYLDTILKEYAFIAPKYCLIPNSAMHESYLKHNQATDNYEIIGNYFSDLILKSEQSRSYMLNIYDKYHIKNKQAKVISIFDTTYVDSEYCVTSMNDGIKFIEDFIYVAKKFKEVFFIFKPSKPDNYLMNNNMMFCSPKKGAELLMVRRAFSALENVYFLDDLADPTDVIAMSDVVITHCYSSPTADALAAGKKAFWYDPDHISKQYTLDRIEGLVMKGRKNLEIKISDYLENRCVDSFVTNDIVKFKKYIDPFMDGEALNRFRDLIKLEV